MFEGSSLTRTCQEQYLLFAATGELCLPTFNLCTVRTQPILTFSCFISCLQTQPNIFSLKTGFLCEDVCSDSLYLIVLLCFVAHNVTVEEILSSYKQACQKLNCKAIPKVLKQIQVSFSVSLSHTHRFTQRDL